MPPSVPRLPDGTPLDSRNFEFHDKSRKITEGEKRGIALAWSLCANSPGYTVVLVKADGLVAQALGCADVTEAAAALCAEVEQKFRSKDRFMHRMVAVMNFAPTYTEAEAIARSGADAIFAPAHHGEGSSDREKDLRFRWDGDVAQHRGGHQKRAIIRPRYKLIRVKGEGDDVLEAARRRA